METIKLTPKRKEIIKEMGFKTLIELLRYYPYRYDHFKAIKPSFKDHEKKICFEGLIVSKINTIKINKGRTKTTFILRNSNDDYLNVCMFNRFTSNYIKQGCSIVVSGKYDSFKNEVVVSSFFLGSLEGKEKFTSIYTLPSTIKDSSYRQLVKYLYDEALSHGLMQDIIPIDFIYRYNMTTLKNALNWIHNPTNEEQLNQALTYLKYEEFLTFCLVSSIKRKMLNDSNEFKIKKIDMDYIRNFVSTLPFTLSVDQKQVIKEILKDMASPSTMTRLLQGDVGSGKTIVSIIALLANFKAGYQGAIMAPTDILARQHYQSFISTIKDKNINIVLLVSDMPTKDKNKALEDIKDGKANIIIGTHSLISNNVVYKNLGLAVIDEQHRFGVKQRVALKEKGKLMDVLYMSATPIPRTLASTIYMDMDVSTIENYPYKNRIIHTKYINDNSILPLKKEILSYLNNNKKIYVVAPSIKESINEMENVNRLYEKWMKHFPFARIAMMHGNLSASEKDDIMNKFINDQYNVLISTTVIEVGINVIDANMVIIYNAERFGLASIHQLRGRIARDGQEGFCYLLSDNDDIDVKERLSFIENNNDGFKISEYDLKRRGAGDMLGTIQSGKTPFTIANLIDDYDLLKLASKDCLSIINNKDKYKRIYDYAMSIILKSDQYVD